MSATKSPRDFKADARHRLYLGVAGRVGAGTLSTTRRGIKGARLPRVPECQGVRLRPPHFRAGYARRRWARVRLAPCYAFFFASAARARHRRTAPRPSAVDEEDAAAAWLQDVLRVRAGWRRGSCRIRPGIADGDHASPAVVDGPNIAVAGRIAAAAVTNGVRDALPAAPAPPPSRLCRSSAFPGAPASRRR